MAGIPVPIDTSALNRRISALEAQVRALQGARSLAAATISEGGLTIRDGGDLTIRDGGELHVDGLSTFGGDMRVTGTLSLPAGVIDNDALASPADFARSGGGVGGFTVTTAGVDVASQTLAVPKGYSRAIVFAIATASCRNTGTGLDYLYVGAKIGSTTPNATFVGVAPGSWGTAAGSATRVISGLAGGTITVTANIRAQVAAWSDASNSANVDVLGIFLR